MTFSTRPCHHWVQQAIRSASTRILRKRYISRSSRSPPDLILGLPMTHWLVVRKQRTGKKGNPSQYLKPLSGKKMWLCNIPTSVITWSCFMYPICFTNDDLPPMYALHHLVIPCVLKSFIILNDHTPLQAFSTSLAFSLTLMTIRHSQCIKHFHWHYSIPSILSNDIYLLVFLTILSTFRHSQHLFICTQSHNTHQLPDPTSTTYPEIWFPGLSGPVKDCLLAFCIGNWFLHSPVTLRTWRYYFLSLVDLEEGISKRIGYAYVWELVLILTSPYVNTVPCNAGSIFIRSY